MVVFDWNRFDRFRRHPDTDQRLHAHDDHRGRPRRARPWILVAAVALLVALFVYVVATDDGEPVGLRGERGHRHEVEASAAAVTA